MSQEQLELRATLGELVDEAVDQSGPHQGSFIYVDISSIDRESKHIVAAKTLSLDQAPSRAKQVLRAGDVLVSMTRPNLNAVAVVSEQLDGAIGSTAFHVLRSRWLRPKFLHGLVQTQDFIDAMSGVVQGALYPAVRPRDISGYCFQFQTPEQQTRIVEKLEELLSDLDAGVAELRAAQKKLGRYRQSLLKAAVEGALTAEWRKHNRPRETGAQLLERILTERRARWEAKQLAKFKEQGKTPPKDWQKKYPEPVQPDTTNLLRLPDGWVWATLEQLSEFITSGSRGWAEYYAESGATFIRSQNINKDRLDLSDIAFVRPPVSMEGMRTRVRSHDLLLTITGANVGKAAWVEGSIGEAYVSQHVALIRPIETTLAPFLHMFLIASAGGRGHLNKEAYGAGKPGLNLQQVGALTVPLPSSAEIPALVDSMTGQVKALTEQTIAIELAFKQSAAQRKNILKAAFSGQLVPQDPSDEPASALLARIRAERKKRTGAHSTRTETI
ncbi:MAG: restriction endonuclease [Nitrospira sp.]|nr:restriction endonuclease [Nitrospira sp.]